MGIKESDFLAQIDKDLEGIPEDEFNTDARRAQLFAALERYSDDRPREIVVDVSGDGGNYYEINTTSFIEWVEGFSRIIKIEYPAATIASDEAPTYLEDEDWRDDYYAAGKRYLYLPNHSPSASETMRITYAAPYVFSAPTGEEIEASVPSQDFYAVCKLSAGYCCYALAAKYGQSMDPTLGADVVNYAQKSDFYERRGDKFVALYEEHMGIQEGTAPAGVISEWDVETPYIFHGRKTR